MMVKFQILISIFHPMHNSHCKNAILEKIFLVSIYNMVRSNYISAVCLEYTVILSFDFIIFCSLAYITFFVEESLHLWFRYIYDMDAIWI